MSNARSPRDVCSTTIGTRGLMVLALFRFLAANPAERAEDWSSPHGRAASLATGTWPPRPLLDAVLDALRRWTPASCAARRPELSAALLSLVGRPDLLARAGLSHGDRLGRGGHPVDRLSGGHVLSESL